MTVGESPYDVSCRIGFKPKVKKVKKATTCWHTAMKFYSHYNLSVQYCSRSALIPSLKYQNKTINWPRTNRTPIIQLLSLLHLMCVKIALLTKKWAFNDNLNHCRGPLINMARHWQVKQYDFRSEFRKCLPITACFHRLRTRLLL